MIRDEGEDRLADLVDAQLRYLQGRGPEPDLASWVVHDRTEAVRILKLVEVLADSLPVSPPVEEDPVAIELGLVETKEKRASVTHTRDLIPCAWRRHVPGSAEQSTVSRRLAIQAASAPL